MHLSRSFLRRRPRAVATLAAALLAVAIQPADAAKKEKTPKVDPFAATMPADAPPPAANGAIFQASLGYAPLTSGSRAAMVGDVVTIILVEATQAVKSNSASTDRSANIGLTPPTTGPLSFFSASDASLGGASTFAGKGAAAQSNSLNGAISVTIAKLLPNGNFIVKGQKHLTLNRGDEVIQIAGIVRPNDIDSTNSVLSTRVADAQITYTGKGEIARASTQGWLGRFFSRISPF
jgi:flagellar L-ring protein precursor FlgH